MIVYACTFYRQAVGAVCLLLSYRALIREKDTVAHRGRRMDLVRQPRLKGDHLAKTLLETPIL